MAFIPNSLSNLPDTSGKIFFVDSGADRASDGNAGRDPNVPMATLDAAVARCTASNGDMIVLMPGHAEAAVTAAISLDVAGVWVYGLGWGASRPTFTFTGTAGSIVMSAASCRLTNVRLVPGVANVVAAITMTGNDLIVEECETLSAAAFEFTSLIDVGAETVGSSRSIIRNNVLKCLFTAASSTSGILLSGSDDVSIYGNHIAGFFAEHVIDNTSGDTPDECLGLLIANNWLQQVGSGTDLVVEMDANSTGLMSGNRMSGTQALDGNVTPGNVRCVDNWLTDADDVHGLDVPTALAT